MKKLRLLVTEKCNRSCKGCCNKDWNLKELPVCESFEGYDEVILTGGEPMLDWIETLSIAFKIRDQNSTCKIYMYTAMTTKPSELAIILDHIDGLCITLHEQDDFMNWLMFANDIKLVEDKSLRLNVFKGIDIRDNLSLAKKWEIRENIRWKKDCPLPKDEVFMRL
jgi:pyruvate formate-lyase activating enzyme-like uncharacterized protein